MAYTAWSVVYGEQPTAAKWNQLGANDAGFKDGTNIDAGAITATKLGNQINSRNIGYSKVAMGNTGTTTGIPLSGINVPGDWVSGTSIDIKCSSRNTSASGTVVRRLDLYRFRNGVALAAIASAYNVDRAVSSTAVSYSTLYTIAAGDIQAGDAFAIILSRLGDNGGDNNTGIEDVDIAWIEYTGKV